MWVCQKCGKSVKDSLDMCHNCGAANRSARPADSQPEPQVSEPSELPEPELPEPELPEPPDFQEAADLQQESTFPGISTSSDGSGLPRELDWLKQYDQGPKPKIGPSWVCPGCGETVEGNFNICWNCQTARSGDRLLDSQYEPETPGDVTAAIVSSKPSKRSQRVAFRCFRDRWKSWDELFQEAADFAGAVGPQRLISISHSADQSDGVVTVWYWTE